MSKILQNSDLELLELIKNIEDNEEIRPDILQSSLYITETYVQSIIEARYITDQHINLILTEIIQTNITANEMMNRIKSNIERQDYDPKVASSIIYILELYIKTAIKTKELAKPYLYDYTRGYIARIFNCGEYAEPVETVLKEMFKEERQSKENEGSIIAKKLIAKYKSEMNNNTIYLD